MTRYEVAPNSIWYLLVHQMLVLTDTQADRQTKQSDNIKLIATINLKKIIKQTNAKFNRSMQKTTQNI